MSIESQQPTNSNDSEQRVDPSTIETPSSNEVRAAVLAETQDDHDQIITKERRFGRGVLVGVPLAITGVLAAGSALFMSNTEHTDPNANTNTTSPTGKTNETQTPTSSIESPLASPTNLGPLETEKPTPSANPEVKTTYTVEQLKAMTPAEYNALPRNERLVLVQDMLKDAKKVTAYYGDVYNFNPLDVASEKNSAQEIMNQIKYTIQLPLFQKESPAADDMRINKTNAQKAMSAAFYDVSGEVTPLFTDMENKIQKTNTILEVTDKYSNVKEVGPPQITVDQQGKEIQYRTITFLSGEVNTHTAKVVFTQTSNGKGIWQLYDFNDKA